MVDRDDSGQKPHRFRIGTAGWTLPRPHAERFAAEGSHLERYSATLDCVEVNSSFHRPHRRGTWQRWAANAPASFRFAVKLPKRITHEAKLRSAGALLLSFFDEVSGLNTDTEPKLGPVLVQLPPSLTFDEGVVREFLGTVRELYQGALVIEPRHASWFGDDADRLMRDFDAGRVAADPPAGSLRATEPSGSPAVSYWRLHGSPRTYYSDYDENFLRGLAQRLAMQKEPHAETWVIFDNTALGHATANALRLQQILNT